MNLGGFGFSPILVPSDIGLRASGVLWGGRTTSHSCILMSEAHEDCRGAAEGSAEGTPRGPPRGI
eukprot:6159547-Alexandrium_andersonii.AAC.1